MSSQSFLLLSPLPCEYGRYRHLNVSYLADDLSGRGACRNLWRTLCRLASNGNDYGLQCRINTLNNLTEVPLMLRASARV